MKRKIDVGSVEREKAIAFINLDFAIDMSEHTGAAKTAAGFTRDAKKFWNEMLKQYPQLFSAWNKDLITNQKRAPIIDDTWLMWHLKQRIYKGDKLVHHHVEQGPWAVGIPQAIHREFYPEMHPWTNPGVLE